MTKELHVYYAYIPDLYIAKNRLTGKTELAYTDLGEVVNAGFHDLDAHLISLQGDVFELKTPIKPKTDAVLEGVYPAATLKAVPGFNDSMIKYTGTEDLTRFTLRNLKLDGFKQAQSQGHGVYIERPKRVILENFLVYDVKENGVYFKKSPSYAIGSILRHGEIRLCEGNGLKIEDVTDAMIHDMVIARNNSHGVRLHSTSHQLTHCRIGVNGQDVYDAHNIALIAGANETLISNNVIEAASLHGILVNSDRNLIVDNILRNNGQKQANSYDAIFLAELAELNKISDNKCLDTQTPKTQRYGIREVKGASNNLLENNDVRGNTQPKGIFSEGTDTIIRFNAGYNDSARI